MTALCHKDQGEACRVAAAFIGLSSWPVFVLPSFSLNGNMTGGKIVFLKKFLKHFHLAL